MKKKTKLYRNLKPGDKFKVYREDGRSYTVTVYRVQESTRSWYTGKRQWEVLGDYPFWWTTPIRAYHDEKTTLET